MDEVIKRLMKRKDTLVQQVDYSEFWVIDNRGKRLLRISEEVYKSYKEERKCI